MPAITGAISGGAVSLLAPYVNWSIEKRRELRKSQAALLASVRDLLKYPPAAKEFARHPAYFQIKHFLLPKTVAAVELHGKDNAISLTRGGSYAGANQYAHHVLTDIASIEKTWGLI